LSDDRIPTSEVYRGVGLHCGQSPARLKVVRAAIDRVIEMTDVDALVAYADNIANPPEARLLAAAHVEAIWQLCAEDRRNRPKVDLDYVRSLTAGLDSNEWRSPTHYCSLLDGNPVTGGAAPRER
jgi:hypothetical protein